MLGDASQQQQPDKLQQPWDGVEGLPSKEVMNQNDSARRHACYDEQVPTVLLVWRLIYLS